MPKLRDTAGQVNEHGAYICGACVEGHHLGVLHGGTQWALCQCTCDGQHDKWGSHKSVVPLNK